MTDAPQDHLQITIDLTAEDAEGPGRRAKKAQQAPDRRCLPRPVGPEQPGHARPQLDAQVVEGDGPPENAVEAFDRDHELSRDLSSARRAFQSDSASSPAQSGQVAR